MKFIVNTKCLAVVGLKRPIKSPHYYETCVNFIKNGLVKFPQTHPTFSYDTVLTKGHTYGLHISLSYMKAFQRVP
jgi:hypothetical protein